MRQQVGSVALNLGSREGVGFDMGVGKMVSHFQAVKPSTEHFPGEKFSGRMEGRDEKGHRVKEISSFFFFFKKFHLVPESFSFVLQEMWKPRKHLCQ